MSGCCGNTRGTSRPPPGAAGHSSQSHFRRALRQSAGRFPATTSWCLRLFLAIRRTSGERRVLPAHHQLVLAGGHSSPSHFRRALWQRERRVLPAHHQLVVAAVFRWGLALEESASQVRRSCFQASAVDNSTSVQFWFPPVQFPCLLSVIHLLTRCD